jgi:hypothetical protein
MPAQSTPSSPAKLVACDPETIADADGQLLRWSTVELGEDLLGVLGPVNG